MDGRVEQFISRQTCVSICCGGTGAAIWCFTAFYAFDKGEDLLFVKSSPETRHGQLLVEKPHVAGTILPDRLRPLAIRGIQFEGVLLPADAPQARKAYAAYHRRFPFSLAIPGEVWTIRLDAVKYTDNTLGFGTKLNWSRATDT